MIVPIFLAFILLTLELFSFNYWDAYEGVLVIGLELWIELIPISFAVKYMFVLSFSPLCGQENRESASLPVINRSYTSITHYGFIAMGYRSSGILCFYDHC